jgi:three-Cys-motif partner protein
MMIPRLPELRDDGLTTPEVGAWAEDKYRLVGNYAAMFATSMRKKWECRVYIDLFAGAGRARIEGTKRIIPASPILALNIEDQFDIYIFCESDETKASALEERVSKTYPSAEVRFLYGDTNNLTQDILREIPQASRQFKVLGFCFVDPYSLRNLNFNTIRALSSRLMDFLVLIPSYMDANRNIMHYLNPENPAVDQFLGDPGWRKDWQQTGKRGEDFATFFVDRFGKQMSSMGYLYPGIQDTKLIRSVEKNLPLYHLCFFSRNKLGHQFWKQAMKYSQDQFELFSS